MDDASSCGRARVDGLQVAGLSIALSTHGRESLALDGVSLAIAPGRTLCLAGESGSGKSLFGLALANLLPEVALVAAGQAWLDGQCLLGAEAELSRRQRAGRDIGIIFQEPMTALNPVLTIGSQLAEVPRLHGHGARQAHEMAVQMLERVCIAHPQDVMRAYPHQLSGGQRQRVLIAMALILSPRLVIADEPTTALDVTLQAEILSLLQELQREQGTALLFITHDLAVVAEIADHVVVLYAGRVVESASAAELFARPLHPYTRGLLAARPPLDGGGSERVPLTAIEGSVPAPGRWPRGCGFSPRCAMATERCRAESPALEARSGDASPHRIACFESA
jgi:peptide/nickel transport system ATP-binding protein/oligopeptide transport system ATP-binding protein